jgi:hypothetical protein
MPISMSPSAERIGRHDASARVLICATIAPPIPTIHIPFDDEK